MISQEERGEAQGERYGELLELVSLEKQVPRQAPPFFIWHNADDVDFFPFFFFFFSASSGWGPTA